MTDSSRPPRSFTVTLPRRSHWYVLGGFAAGGLLFALLWAGTREKRFYVGDAAGKDDMAEIAVAPLPAPVAGGGRIELPPPTEVPAGVQPQIVENRPAPPPAPAASDPASTASPAEGNIRVLESPPQRIVELSPAPEYPASALRANQSGSVLLDVQVDAQGNVTAVRIARRSGSRALDRAAVQAVEQWRFTPATVNGQPVEGQVQIPIDFMP